MLIVVAILVLYVIASAYYIHLLHERLRSNEENWNQIEKITDHNESGDITIHARKVPDDVVIQWHNDEAELLTEQDRLLKQRDGIDSELTAIAQLLRLSR